MLIEHRTYSLRLGAVGSFWDAQKERGDSGLAPIIERLLATFSAESGDIDQIVSLYRYDDFNDWETRLLGLYKRLELLTYFQAVRPLIVSQESKFLRPSPIPELTPYWGNGNDWRKGHGPLINEALAQSNALFEETTLTFSAGGVPACWGALRQHGLDGQAMMQKSLLGVFSTIAGQLNQVVIYRVFTDMESARAHRKELDNLPAWRAFLASVSPLAVKHQVRLFSPSPVADLSPLFK